MSYYLIYGFSWFVGIFPYKIQFLLSDVIRGVLYYLVRYRRSVVRENLRTSFPEKSVRELRRIERKFYAHLADVFVETMSMASVTRRKIERRIRFVNVEQIERQTQGRSFISAMAHYGSWEYTCSYPLHSRHDDVLAVYRPLQSEGFDRFYHKIRSRFGATPTSMEEVTREVIRRQAKQSPVAIALIADQTPPYPSIQNWTLFLGRWTPFFLGMEKMALKFHLPVVFLSMKKVKRGRYEATFEMIYDGDETVKTGEITRRYAERLEQMIRTRPELWMWSHRRWKYAKKREE